MSGLAVQIRGVEVVSGPILPGAKEFCACDFYCTFEELVFANPGSDSWKKDYTSFLTKKLSSSDTVTIKLYRNGLEVATITDNTYGTYYSTFTAQPLYVGFVVDWTLVFNAFSGGQYYIEIESVLAGNSQTFQSRMFRLNAYNIEQADQTIKIEAYQTGNIISDPFDYTDLVTGGWYSAMRLPGKLENKTPTLEVDNYLQTDYTQIQNRSQVSFTYLLKLANVPQSIFNVIAENYSLANRILLTNYDAFEDVVLRGVEVMTESFSRVDHLANGRGYYDISFTQKQPNTIKRNF